MRVSLSLKVLALALGVLLVSATPHEKDMPEPIGEVAEEPADEHAPDLNAEPDAHEPVAHKTGPGPKVNVTDPINVDHDQTVDHAEKDAARAADVDAGEREHDYYNQTGGVHPDILMKDIDTNKDGKISKEELLARVKFVEEFDRQHMAMDGMTAKDLEAAIAEQEKDPAVKEDFDFKDTDKDGLLTLEEITKSTFLHVPLGVHHGTEDLTEEEKAVAADDKPDDVPELSKEEKEMEKQIQDEMAGLEKRMFEASDVDKDGKQSFKEYLRALVVPHLDHAPIAGHDTDDKEDAHAEAHKYDHVDGIMKENDKNADGMLEAGELAAMSPDAEMHFFTHPMHLREHLPHGRDAGEL